MRRHTLACVPVLLGAVAAQEPAPEGGVSAATDALPLTLSEALRLGMEHNTGLKIDKLLPFIAAEDLRGARAIFEPELFATATIARSENPARQLSQVPGFVSPAVTTELYQGRFGIRQLVPSGGLLDLAFEPQQFSQTGAPRQYDASFTMTLTQPLLRGAWSDYTLRDVRSREVQRAAATHRYRRATQDTLIGIVRAYWELVFARENLVVVQQALELAERQLQRTDQRIAVGDLARLDRVADEAEVARRKEELVTAENEIRDRHDDLRRLLYDDSDGMLWQRQLEPVTPIGEFPASTELDWRRFAGDALRLRPDVRALRADVAAAEIALSAAERDVLPRLDLVSSYTTDSSRGSWPDAFEEAIHSDFPDWSVRLEFAVPIGNNAALSARDRARLEVERVRRTLYNFETDVVLEVRDAVRDLRRLAESIARGRESVRLAVTNLDREVKRKEVGTSTTFEVQERNQELQEARSRLLRNQLDYRIAEASLLYVQGTLSAPARPGQPER